VADGSDGHTRGNSASAITAGDSEPKRTTAGEQMTEFAGVGVNSCGNAISPS
jgi:hypothetical protein